MMLKLRTLSLLLAAQVELVVGSIEGPTAAIPDFVKQYGISLSFRMINSSDYD